MNDPLPVYVRWMLERDFAAAAAIERGSSGRAWSEDDFAALVGAQNCVGMVAQYDSGVCGFAVYEISRRGYSILKLAVEPGCRRRGVGRRLIAAIARRLSAPQRRQITFDVGESELAAQLFLRAAGFRAEAILRGYFDRPRREDAYRMVLRPHGVRDRSRGAAPSRPRTPPARPRV